MEVVYYGYGFGSGSIALVFVALAIARVLLMRSRRRMPPRTRTRGGMPGPYGRLPVAPPGSTPRGEPLRTAPHPGPTPQPRSDESYKIPPGWFPDPSGRYDQRYWSGTAWTEHVTKDGVPSTEPFPPPGG